MLLIAKTSIESDVQPDLEVFKASLLDPELMRFLMDEGVVFSVGFTEVEGLADVRREQLEESMQELLDLDLVPDEEIVNAALIAGDTELLEGQDYSPNRFAMSYAILYGSQELLEELVDSFSFVLTYYELSRMKPEQLESSLQLDVHVEEGILERFYKRELLPDRAKLILILVEEYEVTFDEAMNAAVEHNDEEVISALEAYERG